MTRKEKAMSYFREGYNCSQAIMLTFIDFIDIDESTALKISCSFGGGMGRLREVCGAFSAAIMVAGLIYGYDDVTDASLKKEQYKRVQELASLFRDVNKSRGALEGSIVCRELLGLNKGENEGGEPSERTKEYYAKRPCEEIIGNAAEILETYINEHPYK